MLWLGWFRKIIRLERLDSANFISFWLLYSMGKVSLGSRELRLVTIPKVKGFVLFLKAFTDFPP